MTFKTMQEREREAYVEGHVSMADLLAELADNADAQEIYNDRLAELDDEIIALNDKIADMDSEIDALKQEIQELEDLQ